MRRLSQGGSDRAAIVKSSVANDLASIEAVPKRRLLAVVAGGFGIVREELQNVLVRPVDSRSKAKVQT